MSASGEGSGSGIVPSLRNGTDSMPRSALNGSRDVVAVAAEVMVNAAFW